MKRSSETEKVLVILALFVVGVWVGAWLWFWLAWRV